MPKKYINVLRNIFLWTRPIHPWCNMLQTLEKRRKYIGINLSDEHTFASMKARLSYRQKVRPKNYFVVKKYVLKFQVLFFVKSTLFCNIGRCPQCSISGPECPLKIMKNAFLFHLKCSFCSQNIKIFVLTFWSYRKKIAWFETLG